MANSDNPRGFRLYKQGGRQVRRVKRSVAVGNPTVLAPGDGYIITTDGTAILCTTILVEGIIESIELQAKSGEGPESADYLPATTVGNIIGIEDDDAEFVVQMLDTVALADMDSGAKVDVVLTAASTTLRESRQEVDNVATGAALKLIGKADYPGNAYGETNCDVIVKLLPANVQ